MGGGEDFGSCSPRNGDISNKDLNMVPSSPEYNQASTGEQLRNLPRLGLNLEITDSMIASIERDINNDELDDDERACVASSSSSPKPHDHHHPKNYQDPEKLRAGALPAVFIRIGNWRRNSRQEGDLVGKFFFASRELAWEILEGGSKAKIEMQWSDIAAIRAVPAQNGRLGMLDVELNRSPKFHVEIDPHPRRHSIWEEVSDFTKGPASNSRFQRIAFGPGVLENHYERIINRDPLLLDLNQRQFPVSLSPHFRPDYHILSQLPVPSRLPQSVASPPPENKNIMLRPLSLASPQDSRLGEQDIMTSEPEVPGFTIEGEAALGNNFASEGYCVGNDSGHASLHERARNTVNNNANENESGMDWQSYQHATVNVANPQVPFGHPMTPQHPPQQLSPGWSYSAPPRRASVCPLPITQDFPHGDVNWNQHDMPNKNGRNGHQVQGPQDK